MISPRTWCYRYYYRHDARRNYDYRRTTWWYHLFISPDVRRGMIIALNLQSYYYHLDTPQFIYRLEPGDIDIIIALTHAAADYRLEPGCYRYYIIARHTPQFMIIASDLVISVLISLTHAAIYDYRL
jgi:hypothetical protein